MNQNPYLNLSEKKILIAGAGVTGTAAARALTKRGAEVTLVDEKEIHNSEFSLLKPEDIAMKEFDTLLVSPGWREDHPLVLAARENDLEIINEIDLAWSLKPASQKWLGLTGTNGKTSTVELAAHMIRSGGRSALACGNVGTTVIEAVESPEKYEYLVLELSSFQLHWLRDSNFVACAILNIAHDHLDWHGTFDAYAAAKISLLEKSTTAILNGDDQEVVTRANHWLGRKVFFSLDTPAPGEIGIVEELLIDRAFVADPLEASMFCELKDVVPTVPHNVVNTVWTYNIGPDQGPGRMSRQRTSCFGLVN